MSVLVIFQIAVSSSNCAKWRPFFVGTFFFNSNFYFSCLTCVSFSKNSFSFTNRKQLSEICSLTQLSVYSCPTKVFDLGNEEIKISIPI